MHNSDSKLPDRQEQSIWLQDRQKNALPALSLSALSSVLLALISSLTTSISCASGNNIDKVYHPYVMPLEREVELRSTFEQDDNAKLDGNQTHRLGIGSSFIENVFTEIYLVGKKTPNDDLDIDAMELEVKIQLTEQGEYDEDWGLLFEYEKGFGNSINEFSSGLLIEKEAGRWVGALNLFLKYEWGNEIQNELETSLASQLRYRYSRELEPALELYQNQDTTALGPVLMGDIRFGGINKLHWEAGIIFGLNSTTADQTYRLLLEYEF